MPVTALILVGCASEIVRSPVALSSAEVGVPRRIEMGALVNIELPTGYRRSLLTGSRWSRVGAVPQGQVYRPEDTAFTIEGANTHEAYLVLNGDALVGFYLPGERAYSALSAPITIRFRSID